MRNGEKHIYVKRNDVEINAYKVVLALSSRVTAAPE
jgi:hypothetical protein